MLWLSSSQSFVHDTSRTPSFLLLLCFVAVYSLLREDGEVNATSAAARALAKEGSVVARTVAAAAMAAASAAISLSLP